MPSRTSFFNRTVFLSDLKRWWPLTAGYALLWLLLLPLTRLTEYGRDYGVPSAWNMKLDSLNIAVVGGCWSAFFTGILFAMAAFSHLTNARATNGLHALPARRETLFVTHYLAGLVSQLAPQALVVALTQLVLASHRAADARAAGLMLLGLILPTVFFYSFGALCMVFTGQILAAPVFYGVLSILVAGVEALVKTFAGNFLYGWAEPDMPALAAFSPIVKLATLDVRAVGTANEYFDDGAVSGVRMTGDLVIRDVRWLWIYAAAGVVIAALALLVYRRRHSEATGTTVAVYWARPVFRYGVAFCAALALGQLAYELLFGQYRSSGDYSLVGSLACMALAGLLGYFVAEMLLKKSFRVWRTGWRGALGVTAALVALGAALSLDLTGYERYVPEPDEVLTAHADLHVYGNGRAFDVNTEDPDVIRLIADAHRAAARDKARQQQLADSEPDLEDGSVAQGRLFVFYTLKSGRVVTRRYSDVTFFREELAAGDSVAAALTALYNDPDTALLRSLGRWGISKDPRALTDLRFTGGYYSQSLWEKDEYRGEREYDLTPAQAKALYDAVCRDAAAGRAGGSLFEREPSVSGIELYASYVDTRDYGGSTAPRTDPGGRTEIQFVVTVTQGMSETLAAARGMGLAMDFR